eukprot:2440502-Amphidinium_carterae.1
MQGINRPPGLPSGLQDPVDRFRGVLNHLAWCRRVRSGIPGQFAPLQGRDHRGRPVRCPAAFHRCGPGCICCSVPCLA